MNTQHLNDDLIRTAIARRVTAADEGDLRERVLAATAAYPQRQGWRVRLDGGRLIPQRGLALRLSVALALLATAALVAALIGAGFHDAPLPVAPGLRAIVVELPNRLEGDASRVAHTGFTPGANGGTPVSVRLPANARGLRWSPDGQRLVYFAAEDRPGGLSGHGLALTGLFVARADGGDAVAIRVPRPVDQYATGWDGGAQWGTGGRPVRPPMEHVQLLGRPRLRPAGRHRRLRRCGQHCPDH